jgi:aspartyl-tRNA(Asn)/glutamyl-tRNA(Gln) amidotransferase subunit A
VRHFYETDLPARAETHGAIERALAVFRRLGARLVTLALPPLREWDVCCLVISYAESYALHEATLRDAPLGLGQVARERLSAGAMIRASDYVQALRARRLLSERYAQALAGVDAIVTAASIEPPARLDEMALWPPSRPRARMVMTPFNVAGAPALTLRAGFDAEGFPLSLQIAAKPLDDWIVLALGYAYEHATDWNERHPALT